MSEHAFSAQDREAVYRAISSRRDVRHFLPDPIPDSALARILRSGAQAPSVGFSQPWNFIVLRDRKLRTAVREHVEEERLAGAERFEGERRDRYLALKLEGILDAPLNICVTCDRGRFGPAVLGRNTMLDADLFSTVAAVQNMWLAARAEGIGIGWVSILRNEVLSKLLALPDGVAPVAYLCVGHTAEFPSKATLETSGWLPRVPMEELVFEDGWGRPAEAPLADHLRDVQ
ncbi:MAG: 5,6-dimethylbenzimidazole synthase [Planctomycetota bacterium]